MSKKPAPKTKKPAPKHAAKPVAKPVAKAPAKAPAKAAAPAHKKPAPRPAPRVRLADGAHKPSRPGGLGRGLDALIGREATQNVAVVEIPALPPAAPAPEPAADGRRVVLVDVADVRPSPWQPRRVFDDEALQELADSIKAHGIIQPLVCRKAADGTYELIGGERRLRAAGRLGLRQVPVIVMEAVDRDAAELALVENLQREDLNVIEEAEGYKALADEFKLTQSDIAERVGKARASVANTLRLLELPDEVKQMLGAGLLSTGHAKVLLGMEGDAVRTDLARQCLSEGLTVRALERRIRRKLDEKHRVGPVSDIPPDYLRTLLDRLNARFATSVRLVPSVTYANGRHGRGRLEIDYFDNDDLSRILELLGVDVNSDF